MKNQIAEIIEQHMFPRSGTPHHQCANPERLSVTAEAIVEFIEQQTVDRVRAMTLFIGRSSVYYPGYHVPGDGGVVHHVYILPDRNECVIHVNGGIIDCSENTHGNCDHIRAVELYLAQEENEK